jgi:hypothetical protein
VGHYSITVAETAPAAMGGCTDATPTELEVEVIAAPTGTSSINPGGLWQVITPNIAYQICSNQAAQTVTVAFNEAVPDVLASFAFQVTETKELLDGTGAVIATPQAETVVQDCRSVQIKGTNLGGLPSRICHGHANFTFFTSPMHWTFCRMPVWIQNSAYKYKNHDTVQNGFVSIFRANQTL